MADATEDRLTQRKAVIALGKIGPTAKAAVPKLEMLRGEGFTGKFAIQALERIAGN